MEKSKIKMEMMTTKKDFIKMKEISKINKQSNK